MGLKHVVRKSADRANPAQIPDPAFRQSPVQSKAADAVTVAASKVRRALCVRAVALGRGLTAYGSGYIHGRRRDDALWRPRLRGARGEQEDNECKLPHFRLPTNDPVAESKVPQTTRASTANTISLTSGLTGSPRGIGTLRRAPGRRRRPRRHPHNAAARVPAFRPAGPDIRHGWVSPRRWVSHLRCATNSTCATASLRGEAEGPGAAGARPRGASSQHAR